jgi:hypothetical protein
MFSNNGLKRQEDKIRRIDMCSVELVVIREKILQSLSFSCGVSIGK